MRDMQCGKRLGAAILLSCALVGSAVVANASRPDAVATEADKPIAIVYPDSSDPADRRGSYYIKLLELAMKKSGLPYTMHPYTFVTSGSRVMQKIADEQDINLTWALTSRQWEQALAPVRISLDKGILGWRLLLINKRDEKIYADIRTLKELSQYAAGQQRDWSDVAILRANGLKVVDTAIYESMFTMLSVDRFQYFPRGVGEIRAEAERNADLGIEIEPTLALHYPVQTYFFVSKKNTTLHGAIEKGLRAAIKDGSFDKLFNQYNGEALKKAHLETRRVFELKVPE
jgi:ABC-type amino acid transport substrate-binding protein